MTVLHVLPDDALGGGSVIVARLAEALGGAEGAEPHVTLLPENAEPSLRALFGALPHRFGAYRGRGSVLSMARAIAAVVRPGDVIHAHGPRAALASVLARGLRERPTLVYTVHGYHGLARGGRAAFQTRLERLLGAVADATVWVSASDRALAASADIRPRGPHRVIENGLPLPADAGGAARTLDLLFVGRLVEQKHPEAFVEVVARLGAPRRALMIGSGELAPTVDALARRLGVTGFERRDGMSHSEVMATMARTRIVVMTSRWEGLPTVALEAALSRATPIGYEIAPLVEILGDHAPALLTPRDPAALAARADALLSNEPARAACAESLHAHVRERYAVPRMAAAYAELYADARRSRAARRGSQAAL